MLNEKMIESTDAEPVAWYWEDATGCFHITLDRSDVVEMAKTVGCTPKPLFAGLCDTSRFFEQPALSAQVQDEAAAHTEKLRNAALTLLTPDEFGSRKALYKALEGKVKTYKFDAVLRALSAPAAKLEGNP
jgi:hypothetical protein